MTRPGPTIAKANEHDAYLRQARVIASTFEDCEHVAGVVLTGGVARGYADRFSELDLAVYLLRPGFEEWTSGGRAPFPEGDSSLDGWHVDIEYLCYEDELESEWDHAKRWDRSYALPLYDPRGLMRDLLARKAVLAPGERERLISRNLILYGEYFCEVVVPSWIHRQDLLAAHDCLNVALDSAVRAVFLASNEFVPFEKWTVHLSYTLPWTPPDWRARLAEALLVREFTAGDVGRRAAIVHDLLAECRRAVFGPDTGGLGAIEARKLKILQELRARGAIAAGEFAHDFGRRRSLQSPFFHLLRRETRAGEDWLVFDEEKLAALAERDFDGFLEWDRGLLRELVREIGHPDTPEPYQG